MTIGQTYGIIKKKGVWYGIYGLYAHFPERQKIYWNNLSIDNKKVGQRNRIYATNKGLSCNQKYGWENIKHEILFDDLSQEEAQKKEIELIAKHRTTEDNYGYNIDLGGFTSGKRSEETCRKIGSKLKGRVFTEEARQRMSASAKTKTFTKTHRENISNSRKGGKCNWYGVKRTDEEKQRIRDYFSKRILCVETGIEYQTFLQIQKELGIDRNCVSRCIQGTQQTAGGYHWKIIE